MFFSFIGFDCVTTLAEEVRNPKRDLPIGILSTLGVATALYVGAVTVLTGMVPWFCVDLNAPLAQAFTFVGNDWATTLIAACTVTGLSCVVLTCLFGQPRIYYRMSKDGLLFPLFQSIHPRTRIPYWGTIVTGCVAAVIGFFLTIDSLSNMISIGTLMAFTTVCAGIVYLRYAEVEGEERRGWKGNVQFYLLLYVLSCIGLGTALTFLESGLHFAVPIVLFLVALTPVIRIAFLPVNPINTRKELFLCPFVPWLPCAGMFTNIYLICSLDWESYVRMAVWAVLGFTIYFGYGIRHSRLGRKGDREAQQDN